MTNAIQTALLLAVLPVAISNWAMNLSLLIAAAVAAASAPAPMTAEHQRDIRCVAFFAVVAGMQRQSDNSFTNIPDVRVDGPRWAAIVGERVMRDTGLPKEVVGFAIQESVPAARNAFAHHNPKVTVSAYTDDCLPVMRRDIAETDALSQPLPKPKNMDK
jgi:hypothetical protein